MRHQRRSHRFRQLADPARCTAVQRDCKATEDVFAELDRMGAGHVRLAFEALLSARAHGVSDEECDARMDECDLLVFDEAERFIVWATRTV